MRQTLANLRSLMREWVDDPRGEIYDDERCDRHLNSALQHLATLVGMQPHAWQHDRDVIVPTAAGDHDSGAIRIELTDPQVREYFLGDTVHKVHDVFSERIDGTLHPVPEIDPRDRDRHLYGYYLVRDTRQPSPWVGGEFGGLSIGLASVPAMYQVLVVHVQRLPEKLERPHHVPMQVPEAHHELIALRAAMTALVVSNREATAVAGMYSDGLRTMLADLSHMSGQQRSTRL